ncbi:MAG TPA: metabolite traffic protein EboE [Pirellulaceae bacterium]|nr:metabolite traffic protein EboE [Pirellulaceae bacterium]
MALPYALGYCTNVHAGATLRQTRENLQKHAVIVKERYSPTRPMGIGLWLSAASAKELVETKQVAEFRNWLAERGLVPYTMNGFPYGDFHEKVVKHRVYQPTWWDRERLAYTLQLVDILHEILPVGLEGSISTLPIAWGTPCPDLEQTQAAADQLRAAALHMHSLEERTGRLIHLCLEPEPGCVFTFADDAVHFFQWQLLNGPDADIIRRHIRICHDVCHAAVMFEDQEDVLRKYRDAGIEVGKIQVSAALRMDRDALKFRRTDPRDTTSVQDPVDEGLVELTRFMEDRYLHQTVVKNDFDELFYEDLHLAINAQADAEFGEWRVHFHVPIYLKEFGLLQSTQEQIEQCLIAAKEYTRCNHLEVETYAWGVLPPELQQSRLSFGIADELKWLDQARAKIDASADSG